MLCPFERGCSNVCEAVPGSLFWAPNGLNELLEVRFEFPFILIKKSTMAFLTDQSWGVLKPWYTGGGVEQGFWCCFVESLNQSLRLGLHLSRKCGPGLIAWFRQVNARLNFSGSIPLNLSRVSINYVPILKQRYGKTNTMHSFIRQRWKVVERSVIRTSESS